MSTRLPGLLPAMFIYLANWAAVRMLGGYGLGELTWGLGAYDVASALVLGWVFAREDEREGEGKC